MNILYIDHYAGSPEMGMEFRPYYMAREWVRHGHRVSVIAGDYSHLRIKNPSVARGMKRQRIDGIDYYWLKAGTYEGNGLARAFSMFRFCLGLLEWKKWIIRHLQPDVVISSSTYPLDAYPAHCIAAETDKKCRHIHEVHDMWPLTLVEIGGMSKLHPFVLWMQWGENYAYRHADRVVSLARYAAGYMCRHGMEKNKFRYIPNGIDPQEWENPAQLPQTHRKVLEQLRREGKFLVGYFGGHAHSNCLDTLLQAAASDRDDNIRYVLAGSGMKKQALVRYAQKHGISSVIFLPPVEKRAIPALTGYFDCIYMGSKDSPLYRFGVCMNKMFDSMMAEKPLIFALNAPPSPVTDSGCAIVVHPEQPEEINEAVKKIKNMSDRQRNEMGKRGRDEVLRRYTYPVLAKKFLAVMEERQEKAKAT